MSRALYLFLAIFMLASCGSVLDALFGDRVEVNTGDTTPPTVRISVASAYVRSAPGDFNVTTVSAEAWVYSPVAVAAIGEDPEGVQFVELLDVNIEPTCTSIVGSPPNPIVYAVNIAGPIAVIPGRRAEIPLSSAFATTRMPVTMNIALRSGWCPETHPQLTGAVARVRARAGNFAGDTAETAIASLKMTSVDLAVGALRGCIEPGSCYDGDICSPCPIDD
jgi:hypothetical protein